jgi:hypothetical protein
MCAEVGPTDTLPALGGGMDDAIPVREPGGVVHEPQMMRTLFRSVVHDHRMLAYENAGKDTLRLSPLTEALRSHVLNSSKDPGAVGLPSRRPVIDSYNPS